MSLNRLKNNKTPISIPSSDAENNKNKEKGENKIDVIILDLNEKDEDHTNYTKLSEKGKIDRLSSLIEKKMHELRKKENSKQNKNDRLRIFVCREYAISSFNSKFCNYETRVYLKEKMSRLAEQYQIGIIPGTLSTKKYVNPFTLAQYNEIKARYENIMAKTTRNTLITEFEGFKRIAGANLTKTDATSVERTKQGSIIIKNTAYFFYPHQYIPQQENNIGDQLKTKIKSYQKHDKSIPFHETTDTYGNVIFNAVFCPGSESSAKPYMSFIHPYSHITITFGLEICAEHYIKFLAKNIKEVNKLALSPQNKLKIDIHFIISDSVKLKRKNISGNYCIQIDSLRKPKALIAYDTYLNSKSSKTVCFYKVNALIDDAVLKKLKINPTLKHSNEASLTPKIDKKRKREETEQGIINNQPLISVNTFGLFNIKPGTVKAYAITKLTPSTIENEEGSIIHLRKKRKV